MSKNKFFALNYTHTGTAMLLVVVMAMLLFQVEDKYQISFLLLIASLAVISPLPFRQWRLIDFSLCSIAVYDIISCLYANCPVPAIRAAFLSLFCLTIYLILRRLFVSDYAIQLFLRGSCLSVCAALLLAICSFFIFQQSVLNAGFQDTYHFRFLFRPLGYITNVWSEVLFLLLGWMCISRYYYGMFTFLIIMAILFSFSRGAYITLGAYIITYLLLVKPKREKVCLLAISIVAIILTGVCMPSEMKTTLKMNSTTTQKQSTEGRITATKVAWDTFVKQPLLGYGNGNYTFAIDQRLNQDSTHPYTSYAPNIIVLLLVEKGIIGILLYLLLILSICLCIWKYRKQHGSYVIGCILLSLAVKEMAQATLFSTPISLFILYVLMAFLQKEKMLDDRSKNQQSIEKYLIPVFLLFLYVGWSVFNIFQIQDESLREQSEDAWKKGKFIEAICLIEQTRERIPNLINRGLLYMQYYEKTEDDKYLQIAKIVLDKAHRQQPDDLQISYLQARLYMYRKEFKSACSILKELEVNNPKNSLYLYALSDVLYHEGKKEEALQFLVNAIRYTPNLLTMQHIQVLKQTDLLFYNTLYQHLSVLKPVFKSSPADYARYGYIAWWCGNRTEASEYLRKAVNQQPNLSTPWRLLGDDDKYRLLLFGAFQRGLLSAEPPKETKMTNELSLEMAYQAKFKNWYGSELLLVK